MNKNQNKLLKILALSLILGGFYSYFSNTLYIKAEEPTLTSSNSDNNASMLVEDNIAKDTAFISTLTSLNTLTVDTAFFSESIFKKLKDNRVLIEKPATVGRDNPFYPTNITPPVATPNSYVVTDEPGQITDKTAVLNGSVEDINGVTSVYFELGLTPELGRATTPAKLSLIGSFGTTVISLTPKTAYYYRAVAKVNGVLRYGDIVSFNTK